MIHDASLTNLSTGMDIKLSLGEWFRFSYGNQMSRAKHRATIHILNRQHFTQNIPSSRQFHDTTPSYPVDPKRNKKPQNASHIHLNAWRRCLQTFNGQSRDLLQAHGSLPCFKLEETQYKALVWNHSLGMTFPSRNGPQDIRASASLIAK